jgi:propionyl-CoA synthetase
MRVPRDEAESWRRRLSYLSPDELIAMVRDRVGPVASFKRAVVVPALPKTRSGKTLRRTVRLIANGEPWEVPATVEDPAVLTELARLLTPT